MAGWTYHYGTLEVPPTALWLTIHLDADARPLSRTSIVLDEVAAYSRAYVTRVNTSYGPPDGSSRIDVPEEQRRIRWETGALIDRREVLSSKTVETLLDGTLRGCYEGREERSQTRCLVVRKSSPPSFVPDEWRYELGVSAIDSLVVGCDALVDKRDWWPVSEIRDCHLMAVEAEGKYFGLSVRKQRVAAQMFWAVDGTIEDVQETRAAAARDLAGKMDLEIRRGRFNISKCPNQQACRKRLVDAFKRVVTATLTAKPFKASPLPPNGWPNEVVFTRRDEISLILKPPYVESARYTAAFAFDADGEMELGTCDVRLSSFVLVKMNANPKTPYRELERHEADKYNARLSGIALLGAVCREVRGALGATTCYLH